MFCNKCGQQIDDGVRFCKYCGSPAVQEQAPAQTYVQPDPNAYYPQDQQPAQPEASYYAQDQQYAQPEASYYAPDQQPAQPEASYYAQDQQPAQPEASYYAPDQQYAQPEANYYAPEQQYAQPNAGYYAAPAPSQYAAPAVALHPHPVIAKVKKLGSSPLFLIATILYTAILIGNLVFSLTFSFDEILACLPMELSEFAFYADEMESTTVLSSLIGMIPSLLIFIGLWIHFAYSTRANETSTVGLTFIKSSMIIRLVTSFIAVALLIVGCGFIGAVLDEVPDMIEDMAYSYAGADMEIIIDYRALDSVLDLVENVFIIICGLGLVSMALPIVFDFSVLSSLKSMRRTLQTGIPSTKGFTATVVMNYIFVAFNLISLIMLFAMQSIVDGVFESISYQLVNSGFDMAIYFDVSGYIVWPAISTALTIAVQILFNVNLSKYKSRLMNK